MPYCGPRGHRIYWKLEGSDDAPALVLLNSIGTDMDLWAPVLPLLRQTHRLLRVDSRGHGASDAPEGDYTLAGLADDVFAVMAAAGIDAAAVAGVSLGGMIAMEMAIRRPDKVTALALICTSATMDKTAWDVRVSTVRKEGIAAIADMVMGRFLSPGFIESNKAIAASVRRQLIAMEPAGYAGCAAAIRDMDLEIRLGGLVCPVLVVTGDRDASTPLEGHGEHLLAGIADAHHAVLLSGHLAPLEAPEALSAAMLEHLNR